MICENCKRKHDGLYGSGRFCSIKCAKGFSTKEKRIEINKSVSIKIKEKIKLGVKVGCVRKNLSYNIPRKCVICGSEYSSRNAKKTCSEVCCIKLRVLTYQNNKTKIVGGYRKGSGRGKSGWYSGYWCDSSYELAFVIYNIEHNITFKRNEDGFEYYLNGKKHLYYPDFIIDNKYYEIKGYEKNENMVKYSSVPYQLIILYENDLHEIISYVKSKYGENFISLYEGNPHNRMTNNCKVCGNKCKEKNIYCSRECAGRGNNRSSKWKQDIP